MQLLQIGRQHLANIRLLGAPQRQFIVGNERGQRRAQLVRHVRIEALHLGVSLFDTSQECIELVDQRHEFKGLLRAIEPLVEVVRRNGARLAGQSSNGRQAQVDQGEAAQRNHDGPANGCHQQCDCKTVQQLVVGLDVQRQLDAQTL